MTPGRLCARQPEEPPSLPPQTAESLPLPLETASDMNREKKSLPVYENVEITAIAAEGRAVARAGDLVVFVPYAAPGDVIDIQVTRRKNRYCEGAAVKFHKYGESREKPFCRHFGVCGGCRWQHLRYGEQLKWKQRIAEDALRRIAKAELPPPMPIIGSGCTREYRNKLEFGFSNKRWLTKEEIASGKVCGSMNAVGFHVPGAFDKVTDIAECFLMDNVQNELRNSIRLYAQQNGLTFFDIRRQKGLLRNMMVRNSTLGETMLLVQFHYEDPEEEAQAMSLMEHLKNSFPGLASLLFVNNLKRNDTFGDLEVSTYSGRGCIYEELEGLRFKISPKSFFQTNTRQALKLYGAAKELAGLSGGETVYDLYTGTGAIASFVARHCRKVTGIEYVPEAVEDAKVNARLNNIGNAEFLAGDMREILPALVKESRAPDVIITDPPRAGMHKDVITAILGARARRIVYVSCNPATQARDIASLNPVYRVAAIQPVDMFPHTQHVENVCLLVLKDD